MPKRSELPLQCASCPFRDGNDGEFGGVVRRLIEKSGSAGRVTAERIEAARSSVKAELNFSGDFVCHGTAYGPAMDLRPESEHRQCPGATAFFKASVSRATIFSHDRFYRYTLWRNIEQAPFDPRLSEKFAMFIGLNPSTADENLNDPTIRRCMGFARTWGFGGLFMLNLFGFRSTEPEKMKLFKGDPVGPENDAWIQAVASDPACGVIVAAWGCDGRHLSRDYKVRELLERFELRAFGTNNDGTPKHPLYVAANRIPVPYV